MLGTVIGIVFGYLLIGVLVASFIQAIENKDKSLNFIEVVNDEEEEQVKPFYKYLDKHKHIKFLYHMLVWVKIFKISVR